MRDIICSAYLDDILCYGRNFEDHLKNVYTVLKKLREKGVKLKGSKCDLFKRKVKYLGRIISENGYQADEADADALNKFKEPPKTIGELRSLLGFIGYYRNFVKDFSRKVKHLYDLLTVTEIEKTSRKKSTNNKSKQKDSRCKIIWTDHHQQILNDVISTLQSPETMAYPDFHLPFIVHCDASQKGLGAVLYQKQNGKMRVISYASRTLTAAEKNYHMHSGKLEFLALKWSITERFKDYLGYGPAFEVFTDNNPLTYVMTTAKLNASGLRWVADLANYQFTIKYRPGKISVDCDYLSRNPVNFEEIVEKCTKTMESKEIAAIITESSIEPSIQMLSDEDLIKQINMKI